MHSTTASKSAATLDGPDLIQGCRQHRALHRRAEALRSAVAAVDAELDAITAKHEVIYRATATATAAQAEAATTYAATIEAPVKARERLVAVADLLAWLQGGVQQLGEAVSLCVREEPVLTVGLFRAAVTMLVGFGLG